jgi:hypothetical protein
MAIFAVSFLPQLTAGKSAAPTARRRDDKGEGGLEEKPQISPLRYAPVEMTILLKGRVLCFQPDWEQKGKSLNRIVISQWRDLRFSGPRP